MIILVRGGLQISPRNISYIVIFIFIIPMLFTMLTVGLTAKFALNEPWLVALMTGIMLSGFAPAVIIPLLLRLI